MPRAIVFGMGISIRPFDGADADAVDRVLREAFDGEDEISLVHQLRRDGDVLVERVAADGSTVVGHILFSGLPIEFPDRSVHAAALAPLAVLPGHQRTGVGQSLTRAGLADCRARGLQAVVVLGHPEYYPRFGFSSEVARRLAAPFAGDAFMALELIDGALAGGPGRVRYATAFAVE